MSFSETYYILNQNVIDSLDVLREIEGTRFDFCGSGWYEKYKIIFLFMIQSMPLIDVIIFVGAKI